MNIVITGGTGFIGQAVAELYLKTGHHVFVTGHEAPVPGADYLGRDFQPSTGSSFRPSTS